MAFIEGTIAIFGGVKQICNFHAGDFDLTCMRNLVTFRACSGGQICVETGGKNIVLVKKNKYSKLSHGLCSTLTLSNVGPIAGVQS